VPLHWPSHDLKKHLTSATKSNGISTSMPYWDERRGRNGKYPGIQLDKFHIDILTAHLCSALTFFDVVVTAICSETS
jgi:tartrate dehydrogenase/decarboxylase/D-malate dehydrogenase